MDGQLRKAAACHAKAYREYKEYLRGYAAGKESNAEIRLGENAPEPEEVSRKVRLRAGWVSAVDTVRVHLEKTDPEKAKVFERLFGLDDENRYKDNRVIGLSMELNVSPANIYRWRESILDQLILAATKEGVLNPFLGEEAKEEDCALQ